MNLKTVLKPLALLSALLFFTETTTAQQRLQIAQAQNQSALQQAPKQKALQQAQNQSAQQDATQSEATSADNHQNPNASPFDAVQGKKEAVEKRDAFSKHYVNEDGSYTALIGAGPIHYEKNGAFLDIDHNITRSNDANFPYANTANLFESYFGGTAHTGVKSKTAEGEVTEFVNTHMYWEVNGTAVNTTVSANATLTIDGNKATFNNMYGNIAAEFDVLTGKRELNYVIPTQADLGNVPANADYLVFVEDVILPQGWRATESDNGIVITDTRGTDVYLYENPRSTDAGEMLARENNTVFEMTQNENVVTIATKVKTDWLLSNDRQYPVKVDPTVNVWGNSTGTVTSNHEFITVNSDLRSGFATVNSQEGTRLNGFVKYDVSSIPVGATINSSTSYAYVVRNDTYYTNGHAWGSLYIDPDVSTAAQIWNQGDFQYWQQTGNVGTGSKSQNLNNNANTDIQNALSQGWFAMILYPTGFDWFNNEYLQILGDTGNASPGNNHRPYLTIVYTYNVACSGTPDGGIASVTPNPVAPNTAFTASVTGDSQELGFAYQWETAETIDGPWTVISGATNATYNGVAPNQEGNTYYRRQITCTNSSESAYSEPGVLYVTTCNAVHTDGNSPGSGYGYVGISNVTIGDINNSTGYYNNSPAYNYYNLTTEVEADETYTLSVTYADDGNPTNSGKIGAWVDWDEDGSFNNSSEFIGVQQVNNTGGIATFTITVPSGVSNGIKRLRVRSIFAEDSLNGDSACTTEQYGETEDYNLLAFGGAPQYDYIYHDDTIKWTPNNPGDVSYPSGPAHTILVMEGTATFDENVVGSSLTVLPGANLNVKKILKLHDEFINDGHITFVSESIEKTAQFDRFTGMASGDGVVTTERFIPAKRSFRFLSSAVTTDSSVRDNWQEGVNNPDTATNHNPNPGFGIHITGSQTGANGFDATQTGNASMYGYSNDENQTWNAVPNTNVLTLEAGTPYRIMVRGSRSTDLNTNTPATSDTRVRATGQLHIGAHDVHGQNTQSGDFLFVGNPYQAIVSIKDILENASDDINPDYYYIWDPQLTGANGRGAYATYDFTLGGTSDSGVNGFLQPGQAMFIVAEGPAAHVKFSEANKHVNEDLTNTFRMEIPRIKLNLYSQENFDEGSTASDGLFVKFVENGNNEVDSRDATKFGNLDENLSTYNQGSYLAIESRAYPEDDEIVPLFINNYRQTDYVLAGDFQFIPEGTTAYLYDHYIDTHTEILTDGFAYRFSVDPAIEASIASDRFEIQFNVVPFLGIDDDDEMTAVQVYPNPFSSDNFTIAAKGMEGQQLQVNIVNMLGQQIYNNTLTVSENGTVVVKLADAIASGVYHVNIVSENQQSVSKKLIKN